jgi:type II secretory pathway pseudopilin PulG
MESAMRKQNVNNMKNSAGMSLVGLIFVLAILGVLAILAAKIAPTAVEYFSVKKAIQTAKAAGTSVKDIQVAFDKQADVGYIDSIKGRDLIIEKSETGFEVGFFYTKTIPLVGPASLLLEYQGTTAKNGAVQKKQE